MMKTILSYQFVIVLLLSSSTSTFTKNGDGHAATGGILMVAGQMNNTVLGTNAGSSITTGDNNVFIDDDAVDRICRANNNGSSTV